MKLLPKQLLSLSVICAVLLAAGTALAWTPDRDFEFVVPYNAGGGSDTNARMLVEAIRQNKLMDQNILVVNKPGGSGAVGNAYTFGKKGDAYTIMTFNSGQMMSTVSNKAPVQLENLTPIATLALDTLTLAVSADSGIKDFAALAEKAKADPKRVTIGGVSKGSEDHLVFTMLNMHVGTEFKYVPFNGGADAMAALLGRHVDAAIFNPSEVGSQLEAGRVVVLATYAKERLDAPFDQVPTFAELGYPEVNFTMFRGYAGPPEMPADAVAFWEGVLEKASQTHEWRVNYAEKKGLVNKFIGAAESKDFYEEELAKYKVLLKAAGILK